MIAFPQYLDEFDKLAATARFSGVAPEYEYNNTATNFAASLLGDYMAYLSALPDNSSVALITNFFTRADNELYKRLVELFPALNIAAYYAFDSDIIDINTNDKISIDSIARGQHLIADVRPAFPINIATSASTSASTNATSNVTSTTLAIQARFVVQLQPASYMLRVGAGDTGLYYSGRALISAFSTDKYYIIGSDCSINSLLPNIAFCNTVKQYFAFAALRCNNSDCCADCSIVSARLTQYFSGDEIMAQILMKELLHHDDFTAALHGLFQRDFYSVSSIGGEIRSSNKLKQSIKSPSNADAVRRLSMPAEYKYILPLYDMTNTASHNLPGNIVRLLNNKFDNYTITNYCLTNRIKKHELMRRAYGKQFKWATDYYIARMFDSGRPAIELAESPNITLRTDRVAYKAIYETALNKISNSDVYCYVADACPILYLFIYETLRQNNNTITLFADKDYLPFIKSELYYDILVYH